MKAKLPLLADRFVDPPGPKRDMVEMIRRDLGIETRPDGSLAVVEGPHVTAVWILENSERLAELGAIWRRSR